MKQRWADWVVAPLLTEINCKEFQPRYSFQWFLNWLDSQVPNLYAANVLQFANVICDFRFFEEEAYKCMAGKIFHWQAVLIENGAVVIEDDASKYKTRFLHIGRKAWQTRELIFSAECPSSSLLSFDETKATVFLDRDPKSMIACPSGRRAVQSFRMAAAEAPNRDFALNSFRWIECSGNLKFKGKYFQLP